MNVTEMPKTLEAQLPDGVARLTQDVSLARTAATGSLVAAGALLIAGRRKGALLAAIAGAALAAIDDPEGAKQLWNNIPDYLHRSQDFLVRLEDMLGEVQTQGEKFKQVFQRG